MRYIESKAYKAQPARENTGIFVRIKNNNGKIQIETHILVVICVLLNKNKKEDKLEDPH